MGYWAKDGGYVYDSNDERVMHNMTDGEKWERERIGESVRNAMDSRPLQRIYSDPEIEKQREFVKQREEYYSGMDPEIRHKAIQKDMDRLEFVQESIRRLKNQIEQTNQKLVEVKNKRTNLFNKAKQQKEIMMLQEKLAYEQSSLMKQQAQEDRMLGR